MHQHPKENQPVFDDEIIGKYANYKQASKEMLSSSKHGLKTFLTRAQIEMPV